MKQGEVAVGRLRSSSADLTSNPVASIELYEDPLHRNILLADVTEAGSGVVQANQHLIIHRDEALILDPGGQRFYPRVLTEAADRMAGAHLRQIFLSHQDPDVVASLNAWLMITDADAHLSTHWVRFVAHFGLDERVRDRLHPIPDEGGRIPLADTELFVLPAHFLHSPGNFQVYDPLAKILYTGDLGASFGDGERVIDDFAELEPRMSGFHRRFLAHPSVLKPWLQMVRGLDIEMVAPQHGAMLRGRTAVADFFNWLEKVECGIETMTDLYHLPAELMQSASPQAMAPDA